jgi:hypothetical protein
MALVSRDEDEFFDLNASDSEYDSDFRAESVLQVRADAPPPDLVEQQTVDLIAEEMDQSIALHCGAGQRSDEQEICVQLDDLCDADKRQQHFVQAEHDVRDAGPAAKRSRSGSQPQQRQTLMLPIGTPVTSLWTTDRQRTSDQPVEGVVAEVRVEVHSLGGKLKVLHRIRHSDDGSLTWHPDLTRLTFDRQLLVAYDAHEGTRGGTKRASRNKQDSTALAIAQGPVPPQKGTMFLLNPAAKTGYLGVRRTADGYEARGHKPRRAYLGTYSTAEDAAMAVAKHYTSSGRANPMSVSNQMCKETPMDVETHARGVALHLAPGTTSGYRCVIPHRRTGGFRVEIERKGSKIKLGTFADRVDAAVHYAKYMQVLHEKKGMADA